MDALVVFLLNGKGRDSFGFPLYFEAMIKDYVRPSKMQSVYIPAEAGIILGPVLGTILNRVDKIKALLI
ncbi:hypothetical protein MY11210_009472 [Beauveria gryllotalpidicola]